MRKFLLVALILLTTKVHAQTPPAGDLIPWAEMQFLNGSGVILTGGKLCSYVEGTTTPQKTYATPAIPPDGAAVENTNAVIISSNGRPTTNGIYLVAARYKFVLRTAGTTTDCTTGTVLWTADGVYNLAQLFTLQFATKLDDKVCHASQYAGTTPDNYGGKLKACYDVLPSTGGTIDALGLEGNQTTTSTLACDKPVRILVGATTISSASSVPFILTSGCALIGLGEEISSITLGSGIDGINPGAGALVSNITITGPGISSPGHACIDSGNAAVVTITHVTVEQCGDAGINTGGSSSKWSISHVTSRFNKQQGIFFGQGTVDSSVTDSDIYSNDSIGVDINGSNNVICDNRIYSNGQSSPEKYGVLVAAVTGDSNNNVVCGNNIHDNNAQGVHVVAAGGFTVNFNLINGNNIHNNLGAGGDGIAIGDGAATGTYRGNRVSSNIVSTNARHGVLFDGVSVTSMIENYANDNTVLDNVGTGLLTTVGANSGGLIDNIVTGNGTDLTDGGIGNAVAQPSTDGGYYVRSRLAAGILSGAYGTLDVRTGAATPCGAGGLGLFVGAASDGWVICENLDASLAVRITSAGIPTGANRITLANSGGLKMIGRIVSGDPVGFSNGDTTPSVAGGNIFATNNSGPTSITAFDDSQNSQTLTLVFNDANTTLVNGAGIALAGAANFVATVNDTLSMVCISGVCYETSRSVN